MGNVLSDGGVDKNDINEIKLITLSMSYSPDDPIWNRVFDLKGYLQYVNHSYLESICVNWSRDMSELLLWNFDPSETLSRNAQL